MISKKNSITLTLYRPDEIKAYLDQYVIGQDEAKKILSVAVYNHYKRIIHNNNGSSESEIDKSNILIAGSTGSGKTYMIKKIADLLGVGFTIIDANSITQAGYVGSDVEECIVGLLRATDYDIERTQIGIVVLDEIDKIRKADAGTSITRDVGGEGTQQALLKMVEGAVVGVPPAGGRKHPEQTLLYVNTKNILFIGLGAFVGIEDIIKKRMGSNKIGFNTVNTVSMDKESYINELEQDDLKQYGFIPEFVGRFPVITHVDKLTKGALVKILKEPKNSLVKQYTELLKMDGIELKFNDNALECMADIAYNLNTGARGLRSVMEKVMGDVMYDAPRLAAEGKNKIIITKKMVEDKYTSNFNKLKKVG